MAIFSREEGKHQRAREQPGCRKRQAQEGESRDGKGAGIPKKGGSLLREEPKITRFEFVDENRQELGIEFLCKALAVSRSGYYRWLSVRDNPSARSKAQIERDEAVGEAFEKSKGRDGCRRIQAELAENSKPCDIKTIASSMKRQGLVPKAAKKFKVTTDSKHKLPVAPNLLGQNFDAEKPNQKWAGDITYLYTSEGWLYLAIIIDLYSRAVIGWSMSSRMTAGLVCDALSMALSRRGFPTGVIVHSDRGSQYCSGSYRDLIDNNKLKQSMSRKGNCWDNACVESFFHSLKVEAIHDEPLMNRDQMRQAVFEYIEVDYNRQRRHSALGYVSPEKYEEKMVA